MQDVHFFPPGLNPLLKQQASEIQSSYNLALAESSSPRLTIRAFGEPTVLRNEQPIKRWRMARAMELFFFLLDFDQPVSKESIFTELWSECADHTNQTFHSMLYHLLKVLGEACVVFCSGEV